VHRSGPTLDFQCAEAMRSLRSVQLDTASPGAIQYFVRRSTAGVARERFMTSPKLPECYCNVFNREGGADALFEELLGRVSNVFAGARWDRVAANVDLALSQILSLCFTEQIALFQVNPGNQGVYLRHIVQVFGSPELPARFSYEQSFPWAFSRVVVDGEVLAVASLDDIPPEGAADNASMRALHLGSLLHIPLYVEAEVRFVLVVASGSHAPCWSDRCVTRFKVLGEIVAHAISRSETAGALVANQHDARDALGVVHLGRWEWDVSADALHLSDEAKHVLGANVSTLAGLIEVVAPADRGKLVRSIERARDHPGMRFKTRYTLCAAGGETRVIQQWHELMFPGERTARLFATVLDVTALRDSEQEMMELRSHKWHSARVAQTTVLVASLAHELSQPLAAILNNAQAGLRFMKNDDLSAEEMRDILTDIVASNRRASDVLSALRAMLRRQHTTRITFDAADAVRDVLGLVRSELMTEQIDIDVSLPRQCWVSADKTQIEQVVLNLVMNSIDAMRGQQGAKKLWVALEAPDDREVQVSVKDSGRGIPAGKLDKVFEAFWTTKKKGLGMGLSVCRAIVESYGGRIWCENNRRGEVTFRFKLPKAEEESAELAV
jgi:signal transduction histidine kinase